jgi:hypothetical protein
MNSNINRVWVLIIISLVAFSFSSCKSKKKVLKAELKEHGFQYLYNRMTENHMNFDYLSAKFNLVYEQDKNKTSLRGQLRIKKDSLIWISFTPALGIEAARLLLTNDTIKFMNRLNKTYFSGKYELVDSLLNTTIDYSLLESMLIGNDLTQYDTKKYKATIDNGLYRLTIRERRKIKRYMKKGEIRSRVLVQQIWLDPSNYRIARIDIKEKGEDDNNKLRVFYGDYMDVDGQLFPSDMQIEIVSKKSIFIDINFSKVTINNPLRFPFRLSSKYENLF